MKDLMAVLVNGIAQLEYNRSKPLPNYQGAYLDKMDQNMAAGIEFDGRVIPEPDLGQRAQFVAANLVHAIKSYDETNAAAMCTDLAVRLPDLRQVKIDDRDGYVSIELVFDEDYVKQFRLQFHRPN